jgi:N,N'-diacetyllegionaminate synthase
MNKDGRLIDDTRFASENGSMIVAEIGLNFDGDQSVAIELIDAAAACGVDAVKFQTFQTDEFISDRSATYSYTLTNGEVVCESEYEMFKRHELSFESHQALKKHASKNGLIFFSSAADIMSCELLSQLKVDLYKIASVDLPNLKLLENVGKKRATVILSTGMADEEEIDLAISTLVKSGAGALILMHCVSVYPTPVESASLRKISELRRRFRLPVGFSDHTDGVEAAIISVGLGSCVFEKHFTLDRGRRGPDHRFSADPSKMSAYVRMIRTAEKALGSGNIECTEIERESRQKFRCSIHASETIMSGDKITDDMIAINRPGTGLQPYEAESVIGRKAKREILQGQMILLKDLC